MTFLRLTPWSPDPRILWSSIQTVDPWPMTPDDANSLEIARESMNFIRNPMTSHEILGNGQWILRHFNGKTMNSIKKMNGFWINQTPYFSALRGCFLLIKSMVLVKKWTPKTPNIVPQGSGEFTAKRSAQRVLAENRNSDFLKHPAKKKKISSKKGTCWAGSEVPSKIYDFSMDMAMFEQPILENQCFGSDLVPWGVPKETYLVRSFGGLPWGHPISADFFVFISI